MKEQILKQLNAFVDLFYPKLCAACDHHLSAHEEVLCLHCELHLPLTHYFDYENNPVERLFWGKVQLLAAGSLYFFNKGEGIQRMMHQLKYKRRKEIGLWMGRHLGKRLLLSKRFDKIDFIVAVPLHPKKEFKRGYNQSKMIAKGIEEETGWRWIDLLKRTENNASQTKKNKYERWLNVGNSFSIDTSILINNKNVLLIDDVVTTGATLEANVSAILEAGAKTVSVATVACA